MGTDFLSTTNRSSDCIMTSSIHTYGPTCHHSRTVTFVGTNGDDEIPTVKAQFFYSSPLPIDDPLTAVPTPSGSESKSIKHSPRPFSAYDNNALEEAWLGLASKQHKKQNRKLKDRLFHSFSKTPNEKRASVVGELAAKHNNKHATEDYIKDGSITEQDKKRSCAACASPSGKASTLPASMQDNTVTNTSMKAELDRIVEHDSTAHDSSCEDTNSGPANLKLPVCCSELERDVRAEIQKDSGGVLSGSGTKDSLIRDVMMEAEKQKIAASAKAKTQKRNSKQKSKKKDLGSGQGDAADDASRHSGESSAVSTPALERDLKDAFSTESQGKEHKTYAKKSTLLVPGGSDTGTTGFPFKRAPSRNAVPQARSRSPSPSIRDDDDLENGADDVSDDCLDNSHSTSLDPAETVHVHRCKAQKNTYEQANVPVGVSRLHLVKIPALQMMPIYWSPIHDIAAVTRGTWFYKDSMYPVEPALANQLEIGYRELRPWSQTWNDELNSAIEVGAAGEEKVSHRIWPRDSDLKPSGKPSYAEHLMAADPYCAARCFHGEVAAVGTVDPGQPAGKNSQDAQVTKRFPNSHVIYKDSKNAFILKPSLQPSEYYGRRPLAKIKKGITVGVHVMRGFDWKTWEQLHPNKKSKSTIKAEEAAPVAGDANAGKRQVCVACRNREERPKVTDLVLVIHGIGQKLSERVESFHFTHAINAFRRSVNVELGNGAVRNILREDLGGMMVLPVNWRSNLSFEDGGPMTDRDKSKDTTISEFTLKDITPDTIPTVRNLISDVMLDIPFYMSHHKPKMIEALITEANRVYRLWCQNNPEFQKEGRVHIIAHSLGSAMALDVLSKQPTSVQNIDVRSRKMTVKHFEFDTKNLFFAGSPAGFFLLLDKGRLMPRRGRNKPGAEHGDDLGKDIAGEAGTFGCLAVDNLYNIMHYNDPIAYRLNAAVDPLYASTIKNGQVPSATTGWLETVGKAIRSITPGVSSPSELGVGQVPKPSVARLPSQLEMEVHDFSREEIAEKKFYLLNDNGQLDYFLSSGGGPLEIQYLNMLSAHSSYWISPDFIRMLVTEVGRKPGRANTLPNMKAMKVTQK
jgi:hypothetical protein